MECPGKEGVYESIDSAMIKRGLRPLVIYTSTVWYMLEISDMPPPPLKAMVGPPIMIALTLELSKTVSMAHSLLCLTPCQHH